MIDIQQFRSDPEPYRQSAQRRGLKLDIDHLIGLDSQVRQLATERDGLRSGLKPAGKPSPAELKQLQERKAQLETLEAKYDKLIAEYDDLLRQVPNLIAPGTPDGGEEANRQERTWGEAAPDSALANHLTLAEQRGWLDFERGAKVAGAKFYFGKGPLVRLEMSLLRFAMDLLEAKGFGLVTVPHLANERVTEGTGFLPRGEERQVYKVEDEDLYLIGTAEVPLTGLHMDEILDPTSLPLAYAGLSPAYRREAGAYGKHSKGLYRVHQFDKLEMYVYSRPDDSAEWLQKILGIEEELAQQLEIPYRVVRIAAGDLGAPAYEKYDLEYWSPVDGEYRELTSCSNVTDYQARRLNIRTRGQAGTEPVHTLNGTAIAISRTLIALLENHQLADGRVTIPQALQSYFNGEYLQ